MCDGKTVAGTPLVQDHKRRFDGDQGPNTGGMGSYSLPDHSLPFLKPSDIEEGLDITRRVAAALLAETGNPYKGVMYGGFIATKNGARLLEYNARFGDPEAMNISAAFENGFCGRLRHIIDGTLDRLEDRIRRQSHRLPIRFVPKGLRLPPITSTRRQKPGSSGRRGGTLPGSTIPPSIKETTVCT